MLPQWPVLSDSSIRDAVAERRTALADWPFELLATARLHTSPYKLPRLVMCPFFQRKARSVSSPLVVDSPTTSPESSIHSAFE